MCWGHESDLLGSRDVIGQITIWFPIGHFLLVVVWNQASNGFKDIQCRHFDAMVDDLQIKVNVIHFGTNRFLIYDFL